MKWLTLVVPVLGLIAGFLDQYFPTSYHNKEFGLMENLTVVFLAASLVILLIHAIGNLRRLQRLDQGLILLFLLGITYFLGEEISWGQHFFGFGTPADYRKLNYQGEMNLHNLGGEFFKKAFDRLPRAMVTAGIFVVGIVFPNIPGRLPAWVRRYVPGKEVVLTAVLAVFLSVPNKIHLLVTGTKSDFDAGEAKEMYVALFILLFSLHFIRLLKRDRALASRLP